MYGKWLERGSKELIDGATLTLAQIEIVQKARKKDQETLIIIH
jgi:hypothetical protein